MERRDFLQSVGTAGALTVLATSVMADQPATKPARIRIGQIGVGHAHASKLAVYRASADYEVVGVVEPNDQLWNSVKSAPAYRDLPRLTRDELLGTKGLQAVLVETEVKHLLDHAEAVVNAGLHVHIDKPAGESLPQLRRIHASAAKQKRIVQMGYMYRYNPGVVLLRKLLSDGTLGEVFEVTAVMSKVIDAAGRKKLAEYRGGLMFELGCHIMDLVIGVLGRPTSVHTANLHSATYADGLLDNMTALLSYPKASAVVRSSALEVEGGSRRHLTVCGSKGTLHIQPLDNPSAILSLAQASGEYKKGTQEIKFPKYARYVDDAADMAAAIRGERPFRFSPDHDLAVQETLLKACGLSTA